MFNWKAHNKLWQGEGIYHLTFTTPDRRPLFGRLVPAPAVALTELGYRVSEDINHFSTRHPGTKICAKQIMPDHLHVVIWVYKDSGKSIKQLAHGFRKGITDIAVALGVWGKDGTYQPLLPTVTPTMAPSAVPMASSADPNTLVVAPNTSPVAVHSLPAAAGSASASAAATTGSNRGFVLSEPYIRTLAHKGQLRAMIDYVHANPLRAMAKRLNPQLFTLHRETHVAGLTFSSMGNHWLLDWPMTQVVQCSRTISAPALDEQQRRCLATAESGAVSYTAAISKGEQQIARVLREACRPLVVLLKDGFPPVDSDHERYYKPGGIYFEACAKGRLLLLEPTPATYASPPVVTATDTTLRAKAEARHQTYLSIPHTTARWRFMAGNTILRIITTPASNTSAAAVHSLPATAGSTISRTNK